MRDARIPFERPHEEPPATEPPELVPPGTRSVSVFLVNYRPPAPDPKRDEGYIFQARLTLSMEEPFVPRPNLRGLISSKEDTDENRHSPADKRPPRHGGRASVPE